MNRSLLKGSINNLPTANNPFQQGAPTPHPLGDVLIHSVQQTQPAWDFMHVRKDEHGKARRRRAA
eukprot:6945023-Alexandrium_andersonii.AAC.1